VSVGSPWAPRGVLGQLGERGGLTGGLVPIVARSGGRGEQIEHLDDQLGVQRIPDPTLDRQRPVGAAHQPQLVPPLGVLGRRSPVGIELGEQPVGDLAQRPRRQPHRGVGQDPLTSRQVLGADRFDPRQPAHRLADHRDVPGPDPPGGEHLRGVRVARGQQLAAQRPPRGQVGGLVDQPGRLRGVVETQVLHQPVGHAIPGGQRHPALLELGDVI
jgi:hypothetical protein